MATKAEERSNSESPWNKAKDDEPLFILRGQDETASYTIASWIVSNVLTAPEEKLREALEAAIRCRNYHTRKLAD